MAASDPTMGVPTPTGTLQGVAAFSWDGSAWQPSGRAGPAVATPTGVLQGVAPFSWDGANWQAYGRAQPGVATSTGVLDGVAVYTWSGSAWVPASGTATPSTPSGALRGVAAFNWDGSAWQPVGRAGPSVATPYGVLTGVAIFGWTGSAWSAVSQGPALNMSFMTPGALDARITFTRASTASYVDAKGMVQTAATNAPRWEYSSGVLRGLLLEDQRANMLFPSVPGAGWTTVGPVQALGGSVPAPDGTTAATSLISASDTTNAVRSYQAPTPVIASATTYTVSMYLQKGPAANAYIQANASGGTFSASCAYFDLTNGVAVVGADLAAGQTNKSATITPLANGWYRATSTFTTQTGSNSLAVIAGPCTTVSAIGDNRSYVGVVGQGVYAWGAQVEQGNFASSYIPTTGAVVTRAIDSCGITAANMGWFTPSTGSWSAEFIYTNPSPNNSRIIGVPNTLSAVTPIYISTPTVFAGQYDTVGAVQALTSALTLNGVSKVAATWTAGQAKICANGGAVTTSAALTLGYGAAFSANGIRLMTIGVAGSTDNTYGYLRNLRYWPRVLSDAEMQSVTT